jgi:hypothetical protein
MYHLGMWAEREKQWAKAAKWMEKYIRWHDGEDSSVAAGLNRQPQNIIFVAHLYAFRLSWVL